MRGTTRPFMPALIASLALMSAVAVGAQFPPGDGRFGTTLRTATRDDFDGRFHFCRVVFRSGFDGDGNGWGVDYPGADINFSIRLSELTKTDVSRDTAGEPNHLIVRLTDDELFHCPFVMMTEPGGASLDEAEAARLREYLLKGGFLWADDFWGTRAWDHWASQIGRVLSPAEYPMLDLPIDHPVFQTLFRITRVPQIPSIGFWLGTRRTSERGADSATPHTRAIVDRRGRVMVFMTHNTDIGDSWEREGENPEYFHTFSVDGYALGINVLLYAMTH
jgi:hypothetical protein